MLCCIVFVDRCKLIYRYALLILQYYTAREAALTNMGKSMKTKGIHYLGLTGELCGVFCKYLWENWPRFNGAALHTYNRCIRDDVSKWKYFPRYWLFVRRNHRSPVNSPHKSQWRGALMFSLICAWTNGWVNSRGAGDLRRHCAHYNVTVML